MAWICTGKTVHFVTTSSLSADGTTLSVTMTPAANASAAGDVCAYQGVLTLVGPGGQVDTTVGGGYTNLSGAGSGSGSQPSTAAIAAYLGSAYGKDQVATALEVQAARSSLLAQGDTCTSNELNSLVAIKETHVQSFLGAARANIQIDKTLNGIDKAAILVLLSAYQAQDLAWLSNQNLGGCGYSAVDLAATGYASRINTDYAGLAAQINAL